MLQKNIKNRTIFCKDNLDLLRGMNTETIDLVYLDPPFNKNKTFTAPIGTSAEGASFKDIFKEEDVKEEWVKTFEEDNERLFDFLHSIKNTGNKYNFCIFFIPFFNWERLIPKKVAIFFSSPLAAKPNNKDNFCYSH